MTRQEYNKKILNKLSEIVEKYPDQRFGQILCNYIIPEYRHCDPFFTESKETYNNLVNGGN